MKNKIYKNPMALTKVIDSNAIVILLSDEYDSSFKREVYSFNETGTIIWELINGENSIKEIIKKVYPKYDLNPQRISDSVRRFVKKLTEKKLINIHHRE